MSILARNTKHRIASAVIGVENGRPQVWFVLHDRGNDTWWIEWDGARKRYKRGDKMKMVYQPVAQLLVAVGAKGVVEFVQTVTGPSTLYSQNAYSVLEAEGVDAVRSKDFIDRWVAPLWTLPKKLVVCSYSTPYA